MDTKQLIKKELKQWLIKRFNLTDKQAIKEMEKRENYRKEGNIMRTRQFHVKNQFILNDDEGNEYLQSYDSIIVKIDVNGKITLGQNWAYSVTTGRYRNLYLGETKAETQKKIDSGEYEIDFDL